MSVDTYHERKEKAVLADLASAFHGYDRLIRQVSLIRAWTIALVVAALGWLISGKPSLPYLAIYITTATLFSFLILELRERSSMRFNKLEILKIQQIMMIENQEEYEEEIRKYKFRDCRLAELKRFEKLRHLVDSIFTPQVIFWYLLWAIIMFCAYIQILDIKTDEYFARLFHEFLP
jgi:hypothetical protein